MVPPGQACGRLEGERAARTGTVQHASEQDETKRAAQRDVVDPGRKARQGCRQAMEVVQRAEEEEEEDYKLWPTGSS